MAKQHSITIGGRERTLKYTFSSWRALSRAAEKIVGRVANWFEWIAMDHGELWLVTVCHGLTHESKELTTDKVATWFQEILDKDEDLRKVALWPAQRALGESGVCGRRWTLDDDGKLEWLDDDQPGKDSSAGL